MPIVPRPALGSAARFPGSSSARTLLLAALAGLVVVVVLAFPVAAIPGRAGPLDCAAAQTTVRVGLVIDFGLLAGEQGAPATRIQCVTVNSGASGFGVLQAGGHSFRVNASGLLCAIDGFPSGSECGDRTASGYRYWAYFRSTGSWTYASGGPGASRPGNGSVEGWHFVSGTGTPSDPPPGGPADPNQICPPPPAPTSAPAPPPTAAPTPPPVPTTRAAVGPGGGAFPTSAPPGMPVPTTPASGAPPGDGGAGAAGPTTAAPPDGAAPAEIGGSPGTEPPGSGSGQTGGSVPAGSSAPDAAGPDAAAESELASAPVSGSAPVGPIGGIVAIVLVVLVGGAAVVRFRVSPEDR